MAESAADSAPGPIPTPTPTPAVAAVSAAPTTPATAAAPAAGNEATGYTPTRPRVPGVWLSVRADMRSVKGDLILTSHHFIFLIAGRQHQMLYTDVDTLERKQVQGRGVMVAIRLKNLKRVWMLFENEAEVGDVLVAFDRLVVPESHTQLYAFVNQTEYQDCPVQPAFSWADEFERLGLPGDAWRVSTINTGHKLVASYPEQFVVPKSVDDDILKEIIAFRRDGRIPIVTYQDKNSKGVIIRASEPKTGTSGNTCYDDERLFRSILAAAGAAKGVILDTRSSQECEKDKRKGGGTETTKYFNYVHRHADVASARKVRESLARLMEACEETEAATSTYLSGIEASGWLHHVQKMLATAAVVLHQVREGKPVVVHGSYGYDATAGVVSLAQLLLDSEFRTMAGFRRLIEKEWLDCGHPFTSRSGLFGKERESLERGRSFQLFVDCVWQIMEQFPCAFEFNEAFLICLCDQALSSEFGTFLFDTVAERKALDIAGSSISLWLYLAQPEQQRKHTNPLYYPTADAFRPCWQPPVIRVWTRRYCRWTLNFSDHEEVSQLLLFLRDRQDAISSEIESTLARLAALGEGDKGDEGEGKEGEGDDCGSPPPAVAAAAGDPLSSPA